jgi:hypothetical protein
VRLDPLAAAGRAAQAQGDVGHIQSGCRPVKGSKASWLQAQRAMIPRASFCWTLATVAGVISRPSWS